MKFALRKDSNYFSSTVKSKVQYCRLGYANISNVSSVILCIQFSSAALNIKALQNNSKWIDGIINSLLDLYSKVPVLKKYIEIKSVTSTCYTGNHNTFSFILLSSICPAGYNNHYFIKLIYS